MPKDTFWFRHDTNAHSDLKIRALIKLYGWAGYGWWWLVVELLRNEETYKLPYDEVTTEALAIDMNVTAEEVDDYIKYLIKVKLLHINGDKQLFSKRLLADMEFKDKKAEAARAAASKRWQKDQDPDKYTKGKYGHMIQR